MIYLTDTALRPRAVTMTENRRTGQDCRTGTSTYEFRLYVTDETGRSRRAAENLTALCEARLPGIYELEVVDVLDRPDLAEEEGIIATPTVIRRAPLPERRVIGDLSDPALAATALDLPDAPDAHQPEGGTRER